MKTNKLPDVGNTTQSTTIHNNSSNNQKNEKISVPNILHEETSVKTISCSVNRPGDITEDINTVEPFIIIIFY